MISLTMTFFLILSRLFQRYSVVHYSLHVRLRSAIPTMKYCKTREVEVSPLGVEYSQKRLN